MVLMEDVMNSDTGFLTHTPVSILPRFCVACDFLTPCDCLLQGPAVWALRAQTDKVEYSRVMRSILETTDNLDIREVIGSMLPQTLTCCLCS